MRADFIIVGGGIIGMLTARELLKADASVALLDRQACGREASWAGGGIISPLYPWRYGSPVTGLSTWAQQYYPELSAELEEETGIDPQLNPCGLFMVDADDEEAALVWAASYQRSLQKASPEFVREREPNFEMAFQSALWMPYIGNIRNPLLLQALKISLLKCHRFRLLEDTPVTSLKIQSGKVTGVLTKDGEVQGQRIVIAAGAWSELLLRETGARVDVAPVKGQMLLINAEPGIVNTIILNEGKYLIPRMDGRVVVGSTLEYQGFDKSTTEHAKNVLYRKACQLVPRLKGYPLENHWAGLRPGTPGGIPFIGPLPRFENCYVNAGHFRNGLVTAPASARLMADLLLGRDPVVDPRPFDPARVTANPEMV